VTMISAVAQGERGYLYADTGLFDSTSGKLIGTETKFRRCFRFPAAVGVTMSGRPQASTALKVLNEARNADELLYKLPIAIAQFKLQSRRLGPPTPYMQLVALAWGAKQHRPRIFVCGDGLQNFGIMRDDEPCEAPGYWFGSATDEIAKHWAGGSPTDPACFHPVHGAQAVYDTARAVPFPMMGDGPVHHFIGGQLQAIELSASGLEAFQLHDWGDRIGDAITLPEPLEAAS